MTRAQIIERTAGTVRALPWGELAAAFAFLAGWLLLTVAIARVTSPTAWYFSLGLLCLCLFGLKQIVTLSWWGLHAIASDDGDGPQEKR